MIGGFVHFIFWKVRWYHREYGFEDVIVWLNITLLNENESNNRFHLSWRQCAPVYKITFIIIYSGLYSKELCDLLSCRTITLISPDVNV